MIAPIGYECRQDTASEAVFAAILASLAFLAQLVVLQQEFLTHASADVVPREDFVQRPVPVGIKSWIKVELFKGTQPGVVIELLLPGIKPSAIFPRLPDHIGQPTVTSRKPGFQHGDLRVGPGKLHFLVAELLFQQGLFSLDLLDSIASLPLEGRMRLGDKRRNPDIQLCPVTDGFMTFGKHLLTKICDCLYVVKGFFGMTDHEVQLDGGPTAGIDLVSGLEQLLGAHRFIDDRAHMLSGSFRRQGETAMPGIHQHIHQVH